MRSNERPAKSKFKEPINSEMIGLEINMGYKNQLTATLLISLINRSTRGPKLPIGRIRMNDTSTCFEVPEEDANALMTNLNRASFDNQKVIVTRLDESTTRDEYPRKNNHKKNQHRRFHRKH